LAAFKRLNIIQAIHHPAANLQVLRSSLEPAPALKSTMADAPTPGEFDLIEVAYGPINVRSSCLSSQLYWNESYGHLGNRRFLESRLAYRIQELAYGGLKKETVERLRVLGKQYDGKPGDKGRSQRLPIAGTRLIREWQGVEHAVTVRGDNFEYQGRPYKSLSAIAREITGVRWNGWVFFGLKNHRGAA
jgi:Protein of unknown function (DUF2924)